MKKEKKITAHFSKCVSVFFEIFRAEFGLAPSFEGSAPRDLKMLLESMKKRSEENGTEWTEQIATGMLSYFLKTALKDKWLHENFLLTNLNRHKDKIFIRIKSELNGTAKTGFTHEGVVAEFNRRDYSQRQH